MKLNTWNQVNFELTLEAGSFKAAVLPGKNTVECFLGDGAAKLTFLDIEHLHCVLGDILDLVKGSQCFDSMHEKKLSEEERAALIDIERGR